MSTLRFFLFRSVWLGLWLTAVLRAQTAAPAGGTPLLTGDTARAFVANGGQGSGDAFVFTPVDATGPGFTHAWRIETKRDLSPAWAVEVRAPLTLAVQKGDVALLRFYARAVASADETGAGQLRVVVQKAGPDYKKSVESTVTMRGAWHEFLLPFTFSDDFAARGVEVAFGFGFKRETIEVGGIEVLHYGKALALSGLPKTRFSYEGREPDAAWRRDALARIEQIRKGDFSLRVTDAAGAPISGATVRVEQRRSAFQWGSALQFARLVTDSPENKIYREKTLELFNAASPENDLKWPAWDGEWGGGYNQPQALAALRWLNEKKFHVRGHVLVWPGWKNLPASIKQLKDNKADQAKIPGLVLGHIRDVTTATKGLLSEWDVLNEHLNDYSNHDITTDKAHCQDFYRNVAFLKKKGAPLGGLGLQGHFGAQPNAPVNVLATLDLYAEFKLPIRFTEFDVSTDDEELQADYTRDFLILAFSHPAVVGVQHWGFWQKAHWRPSAAMFRSDWSEKPNAKVYRSLVLDQWRTKLSGATDAAGKYAVRGFHGEYAITVEKDGRKAEGAFVLRPGAKAPVIAIQLQ
ncbi:MAG: endo-1,4-beta-xylanase [Verrucomicrobia bacterium]|nr:endo-1,4-beta-xylanase [Verrucomicrobiota bacterium]